MKVTLDDYVEVRTVSGVQRLFQLISPFRGWINGNEFEVPAGFVTDFASVPHFVEAIISNSDPDILRPSILHDWLCQGRGAPDRSVFSFSRAEVCAIFREAMFYCGATRFRAWAAWAGVTLWSLHNWSIVDIALRKLSLNEKLKIT